MLGNKKKILLIYRNVFISLFINIPKESLAMYILYNSIITTLDQIYRSVVSININNEITFYNNILLSEFRICLHNYNYNCVYQSNVTKDNIRSN